MFKVYSLSSNIATKITLIGHFFDDTQLSYKSTIQFNQQALYKYTKVTITNIIKPVDNFEEKTYERYNIHGIKTYFYSIVA